MILEKVKDVTLMDEIIAMNDLLIALGYDTSKLTMSEAVSINKRILKVIER